MGVRTHTLIYVSHIYLKVLQCVLQYIYNVLHHTATQVYLAVASALDPGHLDVTLCGKRARQV